MFPSQDECIKEVNVEVRKAVCVEETLREALLTPKIHKQLSRTSAASHQSNWTGRSLLYFKMKV